jgi:hypothetical protein
MAESLGEKLEASLVADDTDLVMEVVVAVPKDANFHVLQESTCFSPT